MDFKTFLTEEYTSKYSRYDPDILYSYDSRTFIFYEDFLAWFQNERTGTHYDLLKCLVDKFVLPSLEDDENYKNDFRYEGVPPPKLISYLLNGMIGRSPARQRGIVLGRISMPTANIEKVCAFWNSLAGFNKAHKNSLLRIFNIFDINPEKYKFCVAKTEDNEYDSECYSYRQFFGLEDIKPSMSVKDDAQERPKKNIDLVHLVSPENKGEVMKNMGIKPKQALGAERRFAMGESQEFKDFFQEAMTGKRERTYTPDDIYNKPGAHTFLFHGHTKAYFDGDRDFSLTHGHLLILMKKHILKQNKYDFQPDPWLNAKSLKLAENYFHLEGPIDDSLIEYFQKERSETYMLRHNILNSVDGVFLGRIWKSENLFTTIMAFWNDPTEFFPIDKKTVLEFFKIYNTDPTNFHFTFTRDKYSEMTYDEFFGIQELPKPEQKKPSNTSNIVHTLPPEQKGLVMKDMGIKPKPAKGIFQRFAFGENLEFKDFYLEATQNFIDKIKDSIDKVSERPFNELFGDKDRFLIKVYNPEFEKNAHDSGLEIDQFDFNKRTYDGKDINTFIKKYVSFQEKKVAKVDFDQRKRELIEKAKKHVNLNTALNYLMKEQCRFERWSDWAWNLKTKSRSDLLLISYKDAAKLAYPIEEDKLVSVDQMRDLLEKLMSSEIISRENKYPISTFADVGYDVMTKLEQIREIYIEPIKKIKKVKQTIDQNNVFYYLVFSRHPIDVLRMADHKGISSCHRLQGKYSVDSGIHHRCAIADAKNDGGIVYLIKGRDMRKIKDHLNDTEIFEDIDRQTGLIRPLGRIRLRRFIDLQTGNDFAIPTMIQTEQKYGLFTKEIYNVVLNYVRQHQAIYKNPPQSDYMNENIVMVGGSYSDENLHDLVNNFFGDNLYKHDIVKHKNKTVIGWEDEIQNIKEENQDKFKLTQFNMLLVQENGIRKVRLEYISTKKFKDPNVLELLKTLNTWNLNAFSKQMSQRILSSLFTAYAELKDDTITISGYRLFDDPEEARHGLIYLDGFDNYLATRKDSVLLELMFQ